MPVPSRRWDGRLQVGHGNGAREQARHGGHGVLKGGPVAKVMVQVIGPAGEIHGGWGVRAGGEGLGKVGGDCDADGCHRSWRVCVDLDLQFFLDFQIFIFIDLVQCLLDFFH